MDDFESIPLPPSDSAMEIEPGTDDVRKYWERAQASLQSISGASVQHPLLPFQPPMSPYYPSFAVNQFVQNYDPPMFNQMPSMYQPDSMDARRLEAERRLRDVMPKGAVIYGLGFSNPGSRGRGGGNQRGGINRGGMQQQSNRPPRPAYNRVPAPPVITVSARDGNFVYSDFFNRMIPESVRDFVTRCNDTLPSESVRPQLEYYLRERIVPLLDSGAASKINWDAEPLPHKINFQVSNAWTPVSKMQGRAPATGANSEAIVTRKRPSQFSDLNSPHERSNGSSFLMDSDDSDRRPLTKQERKKMKKQAKVMEARQKLLQSDKVQKYMKTSFLKEGEDIEDAQRRNMRARRFNDGASSSSSLPTVCAPIVRESTIKQRFSKPKTDDDVLSFFDRQQIERDLASLQGTYCPTPADKYQILLKRDNLLTMLTKLRSKSKSKMLTSAKRFGECEDMCPEKERYMRQVGNLLHPFECNPDGKINHTLTVKDYSRSAADQDEPLLHDLRPPHVLQKVMDYLILKVDKSMSRSELGKWYDFTWSRTRAVRKDITQQSVVDRVTVSLVEKCVRFHIYASFRMSTLDTKDFDARMNTENLSKCLQTLRHMYDDLARKNVHCDTEPEFRAYDILLNLADSNVLSMTHTYRKSVRGSSTFKLAAELACSFHTDNYVAFFKLIREKANYLQACLCRAYFSQIRVKALNTMVKIAKPTKIPISKCVRLLGFDNEEDTRSFMRLLNMYPDTKGMVCSDRDYHEGGLDHQKANHGCQIVENKLRIPLTEVIAGGPVKEPIFFQPTNSFTFDYYGRPPSNRKN